MLRLTKQEMYVVAFVIAAVLVGATVRAWRDRQPRATVATVPVP